MPKGGEIYIETHGHQIWFEAGQKIDGCVHVRHCEPFATNALTLALFGEERTFNKMEKSKEVTQENRTSGATEQIIKMVFPIRTFYA